MNLFIRLFFFGALFSVVFVTTTSWAGSLFNRRLSNGRMLFDVVIEQGVPRDALDLVFKMFDYNEGNIINTTYTVLVDYSRPSTEKRFYLIHLLNGKVEKFYVAHGIRSGVLETRYFSNLQDSWKSSLGFYYAKGTYMSEKNGLSLYLDGVDSSNDNARLRTIVLHGARYVSEEFIQKNGRLGWSEGCFAVALDQVNYLINILQNGSLILSYHKDLMGYARRYPWEQSLIGNEIIPRGVNLKRTPGEGGGSDWWPSDLSFAGEELRF